MARHANIKVQDVHPDFRGLNIKKASDAYKAKADFKTSWEEGRDCVICTAVQDFACATVYECDACIFSIAYV